MNGNTGIFESPAKGRINESRFGIAIDHLESFRIVRQLPDERKIFGMVGCDAKSSRRNQSGPDGRQKIALDQTPAMMPSFGPWVREKADRRSQPIPEPEVRPEQRGCLPVQNPGVLQAGRFSCRASDPFEQPLDSKKILLRILPGGCRQKRAVSAAEIDMDGAARRANKRLDIQRTRSAVLTGCCDHGPISKQPPRDSTRDPCMMGLAVRYIVFDAPVRDE